MMGGNRASRLLRPEQAFLLVVDIQEKFVPVLADAENLISRAGILIQMARTLEIPIVVSEQYPKGLGHTVPALKQLLPETAQVLEKSSFGCGHDPDLMAALDSLGRSQALVCGIEAHICVNQTVHQLQEGNYQVHLAQDAITSRNPADCQAALAKMIQTGAIPSTVEMALFELLGTAKNPHFKALQALVK